MNLKKIYLPMPWILSIGLAFIAGTSFGQIHQKKTFELDSTTKLMVLHGDTTEKIVSVPDGIGDSRFIFILGKTKALVYDTTAETTGGYPKSMVMSDMGDKCLGKEHLRIMREHFKSGY